MILHRYIARHVLGGVLVVFTGLVSLFFIGDLENAERGDFDYAAALAFVVMRMPGRMYALLPAATLIGGLLGLGRLAHGSELTAMRAAGAPVARIVGAAMLAARVRGRTRGRRVARATRGAARARLEDRRADRTGGSPVRRRLPGP